MLVLFDVTCVAFFIALILTPYIRDLANRFQLVDLPDQKRKIHQKPIPRVGGVVIVLAYTLTLVFILVAPYRNQPFDLPAATARAVALAPAAAIVFLTGLLDDLRGLAPWQKLIGQVVAATWAYFAGFGIAVLHGHPLETWLGLPLTVLWLVGCSNALNLIDGMDGLAAGVGFSAALTTLVAALIHNNVGLAMVTAPLAGALLGFLRYNFNPASIFLGDSGSLLIGFLLGCYGALWSQKSTTVLAMTAPLMALAIPLLDVGLSILRRFLRNQPIFSADRSHIHHRLVAQGLTPRRAVLLLYAFCGAAAAFSLLQEVADNRFGGFIIVLFCAAAWLGVQHLGYAEFGIAGRLLFRGTLRGIIDIQVRLQQFERSLSSAGSLDEVWKIIWASSAELGFSGVRLKVRNLILEEHLPPEEADGACWQLRIPLLGGQYINFYRSSITSVHPLTLTLFAQIIEKELALKLPQLEKQTDSLDVSVVSSSRGIQK